MNIDLLEKYHLSRYQTEIEATCKECRVGVPSSDETASFFGDLPLVDHDFRWPVKDDYPLHFVGQLTCSDLKLPNLESGYLLFFYDNRHWGYSPNDRGHAVVIHQEGENQLLRSDLPECLVKSFFGLKRKLVTPKVYAKINVAFESGCSYPALERGLISFADDGWEEAYAEFQAALEPTIQVGGYPSPIQSDFMEDDCIKAFDYGKREDWKLLLQLYEIGDMSWGDAGALYWFIHEDDLARKDFSRVWMVNQCH